MDWIDAVLSHGRSALSGHCVCSGLREGGVLNMAHMVLVRWNRAVSGIMKTSLLQEPGIQLKHSSCWCLVRPLPLCPRHATGSQEVGTPQCQMLFLFSLFMLQLPSFYSIDNGTLSILLAGSWARPSLHLHLIFLHWPVTLMIHAISQAFATYLSYEGRLVGLDGFHMLQFSSRGRDP